MSTTPPVGPRQRVELRRVDAPRTVVVIEDDFDVRLLLVRYLQALGWSAHGADGGESGLLLVAATAPALVVVDLILPDIGGAEVIATLRERGGDHRIVVTSVLDRDQQRVLDPDGVLPKPFTRRDVGRVMLEAMADRRPDGVPARRTAVGGL